MALMIWLGMYLNGSQIGIEGNIIDPAPRRIPKALRLETAVFSGAAPGRMINRSGSDQQSEFGRLRVAGLHISDFVVLKTLASPVSVSLFPFVFFPVETSRWDVYEW